MHCIKKIENKDQAWAFLCFLCAERNRHLQDVCQVEEEIVKVVEKWNIREIPWDNTYFVEV